MEDGGGYIAGVVAPTIWSERLMGSTADPPGGPVEPGVIDKTAGEHVSLIALECKGHYNLGEPDTTMLGILSPWQHAFTTNVSPTSPASDCRQQYDSQYITACYGRGRRSKLAFPAWLVPRGRRFGLGQD